MMSSAPSDPPGPHDTLPDPPEPSADAAGEDPPPDERPPGGLQGYLARFGYRGGDPRDGTPEPPED